MIDERKIHLPKKMISRALRPVDDEAMPDPGKNQIAGDEHPAAGDDAAENECPDRRSDERKADVHSQRKDGEPDLYSRDARDQSLFLKQGSARGLEAAEDESERDDRQDRRQLGLLEEAGEEAGKCEAEGAENHAPDRGDRPGRVVEFRRVALAVDDDALVDADVRQQLHARADRVHDQHQPQQRRRQQAGEDDVVGEAKQLDEAERRGRPAQAHHEFARDLADHLREALAGSSNGKQSVARMPTSIGNVLGA